MGMVTIHSPGALPLGELGDAGLDLGDGAAAGQRREDRLQPLAVHMRVAVDEAGHHGAAVQRDGLGVRGAVALDLGGLADGDEAAGADGDGFGDGELRVGGDDLAAGEDQVGGFVRAQLYSPRCRRPCCTMAAQRSTSSRK
jgi:hypothetical protein